ncbi:peptidyl-prolyl cis-trans isomerase cyp8 [Microthyrium microscopicum]|uniref:Peptidyl-prolyl cis-trans isomerase-like 2 n=1 Tax=Microthyrium microscopicum TaxID=703497 RepID=A0A6A6UD81_9PEZI|nr:peptidyl-prolyl cis-trans isomerase cyp8 [Microthyrium microscopicum]
MGKGTDKLYITHSEWASGDAHSASAGAGVASSKASEVDSSFKRLPFNYCAVSLQPFTNPVCTAAGTIFDYENILAWLTKHKTNPVDGQPLKSSDLIKLNFIKNDDGEFVDPVTFKVFTDNTHIVALKNTGNTFTFDTVERLNIKGKNWRDLVSNDEFTRKDIITLQDPQNIGSRNLSSFKFLKDGTSTRTDEQEAELSATVNTGALGSTAKILKAKEAVARARAEREKAANPNRTPITKTSSTSNGKPMAAPVKKSLAYNSAQHTTGKAAASFTSTGLTPHTGAERAVLTDEEYMLRPKRIKMKGYARMQTNHGDVNLELYPEFAPKAVWNFVQLAKAGQYRNLVFHRNVRNFMIQGGDPTGTGRGGSSIWGKNFEDEIQGPLKHDARGILSMANKGKNTNSSQFFIIYRPTKHLDMKHTIFGRVVDGMDTLSKLENIKGDEKDRPIEDIKLLDVVVFVDPFEEFMKQRAEKEAGKETETLIQKSGGTDDDKVTWTGKRIRAGDKKEESAGVGKYLTSAIEESLNEPAEAQVFEEEMEEQPVKKKVKAGGFGNFDGW